MTDRRRKKLVLSAVGAALALVISPAVRAATSTWTPTTGGSWSLGSNWDTNPTIPNAVGAVASFTAINTGNRAITVDSGAGGDTVGGVSFDMNGFNNSIAPGTAGSNLIFDNGGTGATLNFTGTGTTFGNNTITATLNFNDNVTANVNFTANANSTVTTQGAFNWTGSAGGTGGFTKIGPGLMTMGTALKHYSGPTLFDTNSGRIRISAAGRPDQTSSVTVKDGAQIDFITTSTSYTLGNGPLNLNGTGLGPTSPTGYFPGAIRDDTNLAVGVNNLIVLQTDTLIHVQGSATGSLTFANTVTGAGHLEITAPGALSDGNIGAVALASPTGNTYSGGTILNGGTLNVTSGAGLGTGPLQVNVNIQPSFTMNTIVNLSTTGPTTTGSLSGALISGTGASTMTINNGGQLYTVNQTADGMYVGNIAGAGGFALGAPSTNTLTLTSTPNYTGPTSVAGGHLALAANLTSSSGVMVSGGVLELTALQTRVIHTPSVVVTGGKLDIQDNKIITQSPAGTWNGTAYDGITGLVAAGRGSSNLWDGSSGIVTSQNAAHGSNYTSIGVAMASDVRPATATATGLWAGQTITGTDTLVMYTYGGDATLDGKINVDDYIKIDSGIAAGLTGWANGDFNYDGKINVDDYTLFIDANIGTQGAQFPNGGGLSGGGTGVSAVPEPASLGVIGLGAVALLGNRRRRNI
jgi:hypothetical protein